jgi:sugar/nucleoside kinase (ribokinase family)
MLVVVGIPVGQSGSAAGVAGTPALAALAAARAGATVELVGKAGDDSAGDAVLLALRQQRVGHAALLRDPAYQTPVVADAPSEDALALADEDDEDGRPRARAEDRTGWPVLEPEDVQLALHYLPDVRAIVVAEPVSHRVVRAVAEAATYAAAPIVVVTGPTAQAGDTPASPNELVIAAPPTDPDGSFAELLGQLGAALDRGVDLNQAFREVSAKLGLTSAAT